MPLFQRACLWLRLLAAIALPAVVMVSSPQKARAETSGLCLGRPGSQIDVSSGNDLAMALADARCGTSVALGPGEYDGLIEVAQDCAASQPLVIAAREPQSAILSGRLRLTGEHIIVSGLRVDGGHVEMVGSANRLTRSQFLADGGLVIHGAAGRIDHNEFNVGSGDGIDVALKLGREDRRPARDNLFDYNLFQSSTSADGRAEPVDDDDDRRASVALYLGQFSARKGRTDMLDYGSIGTVVENNLFQDVARRRSIHVKSNGNIIRGNTFIESANAKHVGQITIRSGQDNEISGNYVSGRIRIVLFEENNRAIGNVMVEGAQLVVMAGGGEMTQYGGPQQRPAVGSFLAGNQGLLRIGEAVARRKNKSPAEGTVVEAHQGPIERDLEADTTVRAETSVSLPRVKPLAPEEVGLKASDPLCPAD